MMEIWLRSIARAGGVEVPNDAMIVPRGVPRARKRHRARAAAKLLGGALCRLGNGLLRLAEAGPEVAPTQSTSRCSLS